jgi:release factor glutamine methyltransferase
MEHVGFPLQISLQNPEQVCDPPLTEKINEILTDVLDGQPIQYVLGETHFGDLTIKVDERVLIPRPETEEMVEHIKTMAFPRVRRIIDLGTGSGCIALALKDHFPDANVWGVDKSRGALSLAAENGRINKLQVHWEYLDLLNMPSLEHWEPFNLVVSNPPYVLNRERDLMSPRVKDIEPASALFVADDDPLEYYRAIAGFCSKHMASQGEIWVEINERYGNETASLLEKEGFNGIRILKDIHNKERYINARR